MVGRTTYAVRHDTQKASIAQQLFCLGKTADGGGICRRHSMQFRWLKVLSLLLRATLQLDYWEIHLAGTIALDLMTLVYVLRIATLLSSFNTLTCTGCPRRARTIVCRLSPVSRSRVRSEICPRRCLNCCPTLSFTWYRGSEGSNVLISSLCSQPRSVSFPIK